MSKDNLYTVSFLEFLKNSRKIVKNPLPFHHERFEKYGDNFKVKLGRKTPIIFTRDPNFAKYMLQQNHKNFMKSELQTTYLGKYVGNGLLTSNGAYWLKQRRLIQPAFHKKKLLLLLDKMYQQIVLELSRIETGKAVDIFPIMNDLAFNVVAKSLFSYEGDKAIVSRLQQITEEVQLMIIKEVRQPYMKLWYHLSGKIKHTLSLCEESRSILLSLIEERRASEEVFDDLLDMLLEAKYEDGTSMTNEQLIDEILILFVAGHETTSNALSFTLHLLANHPNVQEELYDEIKSVTTSDLLEKIQSLSFTKQCVEESMRLYPPAYFSDRVAIEDDQFNDIKIPKGTQVLMSFFEMHRHPEYWESPMLFNPKRFGSDTNAKKQVSFFPFGAGPRMCIGNNFAMYEMVLAISEVVRKYKITPKQKEIAIKPLITLKPANTVLFFEQR